MEQLTDTWQNMSLLEREDSGFTLRSDQRSQKFILNLCYWRGKLSHDDKSCEIGTQSKGNLQVSEQQAGPSLQASPHRSTRKGVIMVPGMVKRTSSQPTWSEKDAVNNSESSVAASTEGGSNEMVQENVVTVQVDVTSIMKCGIDSLLMLTLHSKLAVVSNSTTTIGSPKSQPIINESSPFNAPLISVVEVKSDTLVAKISDIEATLPMHDNSPIIAPINSNSQQSQWQVFNMVNIPDKEKILTTAMKGNEPDQSNQPSHYAIWKPPPWLFLKVNSDDAIFQEQNFVGVGVVIRDIKGHGIAFMDEKITLPYSVTNVELMVAKRALRLALDFGLSPIVLNGNSKNTIDALMCEVSLLADYGHLVDDARRLANQFESVELSPVKREGNSAAQNIARQARHVSELLVWMEDVPPHLSIVIQAESAFR